VCERERSVCWSRTFRCRGWYFTVSRWRLAGLAYAGGDQLAVGITLNTGRGRRAMRLCGGSYGESLWEMLLAVTSTHRFTCDLVFTWTLSRQGDVIWQRTTGIFAVTVLYLVLFLGTIDPILLIWFSFGWCARSKDHNSWCWSDWWSTKSGTSCTSCWRKKGRRNSVASSSFLRKKKA